MGHADQAMHTAWHQLNTCNLSTNVKCPVLAEMTLSCVQWNATEQNVGHGVTYIRLSVLVTRRRLASCQSLLGVTARARDHVMHHKAPTENAGPGKCRALKTTDVIAELENARPNHFACS